MLIKYNHHLLRLNTFCGINIYIGQKRIIRMDMYNESKYDSLYITIEPNIKRIHIAKYIFIEDDSRKKISSIGIMTEKDASKILKYFRNVLLLNGFEPEHY